MDRAKPPFRTVHSRPGDHLASNFSLDFWLVCEPVADSQGYPTRRATAAPAPRLPVGGRTADAPRPCDWGGESPRQAVDPPFGGPGSVVVRRRVAPPVMKRDGA